MPQDRTLSSPKKNAKNKKEDKKRIVKNGDLNKDCNKKLPFKGICAKIYV